MSITAISEDVDYLKKTISNLRDEVDQLKMLQDISRQLHYDHDFEHIIDIFLDIVKELIDYNLCVLFMFKEDGKTFQAAACRNVSREAADRYLPDEDIIHWVLREGRWAHVALPDLSENTDEDIFSILPLQGAKKDLGFLIIATTEALSAFTQSNMNRLSYIAGQAALALENHFLYAELRFTNKHIKNIIESINNGIIILDMSDRITQLNKNATAMLGLPSADVIELPYQKVFSAELSLIIDDVKRRALADGFSFETLFEYTPVKDLKVPLGINSSLLFDDNAKRIGVIIVVRNMFALKELDRLRQLDELKSEFVSNVSHELRSPLSVIKAYSDAILDQVAPDDHDTRREFLTVIQEETDRLTTLVNDMLDISRIESGKFEIDKEQVDIEKIVQGIVKRMKGGSPLHKIVFASQPALPIIWADKDKIVQVFLNLLDNAVKFSPAGGTINISLAASDKDIVSEISDPGIGIPEEHLPRLFDKFYRVDTSDVYEIPGTGLGLPIVKHIVESHGGAITVESEPDRGSTFRVCIPFET
ncbi:MAG: PAS domain S-box protein [Desulfobacterales bacterium]|nr:PAS domain S-box protein [Desulfobacterales bacterium]